MSHTINVQLNFFGPLLSKDELARLVKLPKNPIDKILIESLENFLGVPLSVLSPAELTRYSEASTEETYMSVVPHTKDIFDRLLKPLRSAKKNYALGEYTATIALCGMVAEMLTILLWRINEVSLKGTVLTTKGEEVLLGRSFERLDQSRRIEILKIFDYVDEADVFSFQKIRNIRNDYLHSWIPKNINEKKEALGSLHAAFQLFKKVTGIGLADAGTVRVNPLLMKLFLNNESSKIV